MSDKIPINPKWDSLTKKAVQATNAGMTYGKYVAMLWEKEKRPQVSTGVRCCKYCGSILPPANESGFCGIRCKNTWNKIQDELQYAHEHEQKRRKAYEDSKQNVRRCISCGRPLPRNRRLYCDDNCKKSYLASGKVRTCRVCGKVITEPNKQIYCSDECARAAQAQAARERRRGRNKGESK